MAGDHQFLVGRNHPDRHAAGRCADAARAAGGGFVRGGIQVGTPPGRGPARDAPRPPAAASIPLRRLGDPVEFGRVAAFLLSPAASYVTGSLVAIDGGVMRAL